MPPAKRTPGSKRPHRVRPHRYKPLSPDTRGVTFPWEAFPLTKVGAGGSTSSGVLTRNLAAGDKFFLICAGSGASQVQISSVTNSGGYTPTWETFNSNNASQNVSVMVAVTDVPAGGFSAGTTFSIVSTNTMASRHVVGFTVTGLRPQNVEASGINNANSGALTVSTSASTVQTDDFVVGVFSQNGAAISVGSPDSPYAELFDSDTGSAADTNHIYVETKTVNTAAVQTSAPTMSTTAIAWAGVVLAYKILVSPMVGTITPATETDGAQPLTPVKSRTLGIATETDDAQPLTRGGVSLGGPIGVATETDGAQPLTRVKTRTLGVATESDAAQPFTTRKLRTLGIVTEADAAQALVSIKSRTLGVTTETDAAQAFTTRKSRTLGVADEADAAQVLVGTGGAGPVVPEPVFVPPEEPGTVWYEDKGGTRAARRPRGLPYRRGW